MSENKGRGEEFKYFQKKLGVVQFDGASLFDDRVQRHKDMQRPFRVVHCQRSHRYSKSESIASYLL
jgi:hypothetical protein